MNASRSLLSSLVAGTFICFLFGTTFSIAFSQIFLGLSLALFLMLVVRERINPFPAELRPVWLAIALFVVWEVIASLAGATPLRSLRLMREEWLFLAIPIGIWVLKNDTYRRWAIQAFVAGMLAVICYSIYQLFTGQDLIRGTMMLPAKDFGYLISGPFNQRMTFGNYYATAGVFLIGLTMTKVLAEVNIKKWMGTVIGAFAIVVAFLSFTRGSMVAAIVGMLTLGFLRGKKTAIRMGLVLVVGIGIVVALKPGLIKRFTNTIIEERTTANVMSRRVIWWHTFDIIAENPLIGLGPGNFRTAYVPRLPADAPDKAKHSHPHNDLLNEAVISGIPGVLIYLAIWILVLHYCWRSRSRNPYALAVVAASVTFFVTSLTESTFVDEEVRQLLMALWAFGLFSYGSGETSHVAEGKKP